MEAYKLAIERNDGNPLPPQHMRTMSQAAATMLSALLDPSVRGNDALPVQIPLV